MLKNDDTHRFETCMALRIFPKEVFANMTPHVTRMHLTKGAALLAVMTTAALFDVPAIVLAALNDVNLLKLVRPSVPAEYPACPCK